MLSLLFAALAWAQPQFGSVVTNATDLLPGQSLSWNHAIADNVNRVALVHVGAAVVGAGSAPDVVARINGTNLAQLGIRTTRNTSLLWTFQVTAPATGTVSFTVSNTGSWRWRAVAASVVYHGINQATPFGATVVTDAASGAASATAISASGDLVTGFVAFNDRTNVITSGASQTERFNLNTGTGGPSNQHTRCGGSDRAGAASVVMGWTQTVNVDWSYFVVNLKTDAGVADTKGRRFMRSRFWGQ